jgi:uncharacterized membrane protein YfcA
VTGVADLGLPVIAACAAAVIAGAVVKGVTGIGLPLVAMPILASFIPVPQAMALLAAPSIATSVWQMLAGGHLPAVATRLAPMLAGVTVGVFAAASLLKAIDFRLLSLILGVLVVIYASVLQFRVVLRITPAMERWAGPLAGLLAGLVGGVSMLFGHIFSMYLAGIGLGKDRFVAAVSLCNLVGSVALAAALAGYGLFGAQDFAASLAATVIVFGGLLLGQKLRTLASETTFRRILALVLLAIGLNLIRKAL